MALDLTSIMYVMFYITAVKRSYFNDDGQTYFHLQAYDTCGKQSYIRSNVIEIQIQVQYKMKVLVITKR